MFCVRVIDEVYSLVSPITLSARCGISLLNIFWRWIFVKHADSHLKSVVTCSKFSRIQERRFLRVYIQCAFRTCVLDVVFLLNIELYVEGNKAYEYESSNYEVVRAISHCSSTCSACKGFGECHFHPFSNTGSP